MAKPLSPATAVLLTWTGPVLPEESGLTGSKRRFRTVVTPDWLDDDQCSPVRFLLYANEFGIAFLFPFPAFCGMIHSSKQPPGGERGTHHAVHRCGG